MLERCVGGVDGASQGGGRRPNTMVRWRPNTFHALHGGTRHIRSVDDAGPSDSNPLGPSPTLPARPLGPDDLALDAALIKVLASDSRRDILRLLKQRRMTLTELAAALDLKKATVLEHLKRLTDANLIKRIDDERLWVYYELTAPGKRVVNPGRTRFYLLMGVAAAALVLGGAATAAFLHEAPPHAFSTSAPLGVEVSQAEPTLNGIRLDVRFSNETTSARAYLLDANETAQLKQEHRVVGGIPLALAQARGDVARFTTESAVPGGTYFVYVVDADGRDNIASLGRVRVPTLDVQGPSVLWRGIDDGATFRVTRDGNVTEGTLLLVSSAGHELPTLPVEHGRAFLDNATLDRLVPADYVVQFLPVGSQVWITTATHVDVREPLAALSPLRIAEDRAATFSLTLAAPGSGSPPVTVLRVEGIEVPSQAGLGATVTFTLGPHPAGIVDVQVGRLIHKSIAVEPDAAIAFRANESRLDITATRAGAPVVGALLQLDGANIGTTNENGTVRLERAPASGAQTLTLIADGSPVLMLSRVVAFDGYNVTGLPSRISVRSVTAAELDGIATVNATLASDVAIAQAGTLAAFVDGVIVHTQPFDIGPHTPTENVSLAFNLPLKSGDHAVRVVAEPLARATISFVNESTPQPAATPAPTNASWSVAADTTPAATALTQEDSSKFVVDDPTNASTTVLARSAASDVSLGPQDAFTYSQPRTTPTATSPGSAKAPGPGLAWLISGIALGAWVARRRR